MVLSAGELHVVANSTVWAGWMLKCVRNAPAYTTRWVPAGAPGDAERVLFAGVARAHGDLAGPPRRTRAPPPSRVPPIRPRVGRPIGKVRLGPSVTPIAFPPRLPFGDPSNVTKLSSIYIFIPPVNECTICATFVQE